MHKRRLLVESIAAVTFILITVIYRGYMLGKLSDFEQPDEIYTVVLVPIFFFSLAYIINRWIMHFAVQSIDRKGGHVLFLLGLVIICLYSMVLLFFFVIKYSGMWQQYPFLQSCYAHILLFFTSVRCVVICIISGTWFALAVQGKEQEHF